MSRLYFILFLSLFSVCVFAQTTISGRVLERGGGDDDVVAGVNILVKPVRSKMILGYSSTDGYGRYSVSFKTELDSVIVFLSGFNVDGQSIVVVNKNQVLDFSAILAEQSIREATVKADPIARKRDTITYYTSSFIEQTDRSIGDVIRKMPGLEISKDGQIKYNGEPINKFYIEGLDMLGDNYGIASNNVQAKDIAAVEVIERHQPIKLLEEWVRTDKAAINLKLKSGAKGAWNGVVEGGVGYKPWLWTAEVMPMYFGRKFQTIITYKTNNMGEDVSDELMSFSERSAESNGQLHIVKPSSPPLDENMYLQNNIHAVSLNAINKLSDSKDLTINAYYVHDAVLSEGITTSEYYLDEENPLVITEAVSATDNCDKGKVSLQYRVNSKNNYLLNKLSVSGGWYGSSGEVLNIDTLISQSLDQQMIDIKNDFRTIIKLKNWSIHIRSNNGYDNRPVSLRVKPNEYFGVLSDYDNEALQKTHTSGFSSDNGVSTSFSSGRWYYYLDVGLNYRLDDFSSSLNVAVDSVSNDLRWHRIDATLKPMVTYNTHRGFDISFSLPLDFAGLIRNDYVLSDKSRIFAFLVKPYLILKADLTPELKLDVSASYNENIGGLSDTYSGYIMTDYRTVSKKEGEVSRERRQYYTTNLSYANPIFGLFCSAFVSYQKVGNNIMYGVDYSGIFSHIQAYNIYNSYSILNTGLKISKRFNSISTTVGLSAGYSRSWYEYLRQGILLPVRRDYIKAGADVSAKFWKKVLLNYYAQYSQSVSEISNLEKMPDIRTLNQALSIYFVMSDKWVFSLGGNHFYNNSVSGNNRNSVFLNASLSFRHKRFEYMVEGKNLLNNDSFPSIKYSETGSYAYTYALRPVSVEAKVRFSIR